MKIAVVFASLLVSVLLYHQTDYIVVLHRTETVSYDKKHMSYANTYNSKYNRTHFGTTFTLHMRTDFENNLQMKVQAYKFASNEYRLFPLVFEVNLCDTLKRNVFGAQNIYDRGNFTKCPMKKGDYIISEWGPDYPLFPPYIPRGSYLVDINMTYYSATIMHFQVYAEVKDI